MLGVTACYLKETSRVVLERSTWNTIHLKRFGRQKFVGVLKIKLGIRQDFKGILKPKFFVKNTRNLITF